MANDYLQPNQEYGLGATAWGQGNYGSALGHFWNGLTGVRGSGDNAMSDLQIGLAGLGLLQQKKNQAAQLAEARRQFEFNKGVTQGNFLNQGTNYLNNSLWQLQSLAAFNPKAGAQRASDLTTAVNQLNQAGSLIGLGNNAFQEQANAISKYNTLKPTVNS